MSQSYRITKTSTRPVTYTSSRPVITSRTSTTSSVPIVSRRTTTTSSVPIVSRRTYTNQPIIHRTTRYTNSPDSSLHYSSTSSPVTQRHVTHTSNFGTPDDDMLLATKRPVDSSTNRTTTSMTTNKSGNEAFGDMQNNMENQMEKRRTDWEKEVDEMGHDFFKMNRDPKKQGEESQSGTIFQVGNAKTLYNENPDGTRVFRQRFDLSGFDPEDLGVRAEEGKLFITAKKAEDIGGKKSTRDFSRVVEIPKDVDPDAITSSLNDEGILTIEGPVDESRVEAREKEEAAKVEEKPMSLKGILDQAEARQYGHNLGAHSPPDYDDANTGDFRSGVGPHGYYSSTSGGASRFMSPDIEATPYGHKLKMAVFLGKNYKASDLTIRLFDHKIVMSARHEETIGGRTSRRQFSRDFDIPEPLKRDAFRAMLGQDGKLYLGGSFLSNDDHPGVLESVERDMPEDAKAVNITL